MQASQEVKSFSEMRLRQNNYIPVPVPWSFFEFISKGGSFVSLKKAESLCQIWSPILGSAVRQMEECEFSFTLQYCSVVTVPLSRYLLGGFYGT